MTVRDDKRKRNARHPNLKDRGLTTIDNYQAEKLEETAVTRRMRANVESNRQRLEDVVNTSGGSDDDIKYRLQEISTITSTNDALTAAIDQGAGRHETLRNKLASSFRSHTGGREQGARLSSYSKSYLGSGDRQAMAENMGGDLLSQQRQKQEDLIAEQNIRINNATGNLKDGKGTGQLRGLVRQLSGMEQDLGNTMGAQRRQRQLGLDTESVLQRGMERSDSIREESNKLNIRGAMKTGTNNNGISGSVISAVDANKELIAANKAVVDATKALAASIQAQDGKTDALTAALRDASSYADNAKKVSAGATDTSAEDRKAKFGKIATVLGIAQDIVGIGINASQAYRAYTSGKEGAVADTGTGLQGMKNEQFNTMNKAAHGDMASVMKIHSGAYDDALKFGSRYGANEDDAHGVKTRLVDAGAVVAGGIAGAAAWAATTGGAALAGAPAAGVGGIVTAVAAQPLAAAAAATTATAVTSSILAYNSADRVARSTDTVHMNALTEGYYKSLNRTEAEQAIDAKKLQTAMDWKTTSFNATEGAGSARSGDIAQLRDKNFTEDMNNKYAMGQNDSANAAYMGRNALGAAFSLKEDVEGAGQFKRAGLGGESDYFGLRATAQSSGGNRNDLVAALQNAVAAGMDQSRNIAAMVQGVAAMSDRSSSNGLNTFAGASAAYAVTQAAAQEAGVSKDLLNKATMSSQERNQQSDTDYTLDLPDLLMGGRLQNKIPTFNPSTAGGRGLMHMDNSQLNTLVQQVTDGKGDMSKILSDAGVGNAGLSVDRNKLLKELGVVRKEEGRRTVLRNSEAYGNGGTAAINAWIDAPESTEEERRAKEILYTKASSFYSSGTLNKHRTAASLKTDFAQYSGTPSNKSSLFTNTFLTKTDDVSTKQFIMQKEGFRAKVYGDATGNATIGYGHKITAADRASGLDKRTLTKAEAEALYEKDVLHHQSGAMKGLTTKLSQNQMTALTSLAFNSGPDGAGVKEIVRLANAGEMSKAGDAFLKYDKSKDKDGKLITLPGLTDRRHEEKDLWNSKAVEYSKDPAVGAKQAGNRADANLTNAGNDVAQDMGGWDKVIGAMTAAAGAMDGSKFKTSVDEASTKLQTTIDNLAVVLNNFNLKNGGNGLKETEKKEMQLPQTKSIWSRMTALPAGPAGFSDPDEEN